MRHCLPKGMLLVAIVALDLAGCRRGGQPPAQSPSDTASLATTAELPAPGEKLLRGTDDPALLKSCVNYTRRFLWIDAVEVTPNRVPADSTINHRFTYTFCPQATVKSLRGTLLTRISLQGTQVVANVDKNYVLIPGQWAVDANILIPAQASPGTYTLETTFTSGGAEFRRSAAFTVY